MTRPDPDDLLDKLQREEQERRRGRLKLFFGASAGVGKTYAMLQAARRAQADGRDVVVGVVETHGRQETLALLDGLETLPLARIDYRGKVLTEFDLDAALARKPQLLLVDELAHTNVKGARHTKRWQDVQELLDAGIDVYTTVNVQHLESMNDVVGRITGIRVWETVPDRVFDRADEVTLVDLPPEELLDRLRNGKVYMPTQAESAVRNFFRKGNLIALRELALRRTADRVDGQMREYRADRSIERIWRARERLIACVGPGPQSAALVRTAARLAAALKSDWLAVYVETPALERLSDDARARTLDALKLASELGAETVTLAGADAATTLIDYARMRNVSKLVAGVSSTQGWRRYFTRSVSERIVRQAADIDVTLVPAGIREGQPQPSRSFAALQKDMRSPPRAYGFALAIGAGISLVASVLASHQFALTNLVMLYLLGVIFAAVRLGRGPGVLLSFVSVAAFDYFFVAPVMSFTVSDTQYLLTFAVMLLTSLTISHLTSSLRREARVASLRERRTGAMYAMTRELAAALMTEQIIEIAMRHIADVFHAKTLILLPDSAEKVQQKVIDPDKDVMLDASSVDLAVAQWVYDQQKPAGSGTDTLPAADALYLPLRAPLRTRGVLAFVSERMSDLDIPEQRRMLETFAAQIALALERVHYVEIARDALVSMESERLRNSLLSAVSHDLRTPLTSIVGFASVLEEQGRTGGMQAQNAQEIVQSIHEEALRMSSVVTNLLDMARLQSGTVRLNRQWFMLEEIIGAALATMRRTLEGRRIRVSIEPELPWLQLDAVLMDRLLVNLLENAAKYTPHGTDIEIGARAEQTADGRQVRVWVDDQGPGVPMETQAQLFEKFTRGEKESPQTGVGLGLAICRAIVGAHGGEIGVENREAGEQVGGARFWFTLPANATPPDVAEEQPLTGAATGQQAMPRSQVP
ncbi:sensor histidine kinase [Caballeronia grimmiae]|nr:sensor histidine kinase KdpD [Caballeronia grimmiae]KDR34448.1 sensor protein KdpD [Caballeronia grimmiae]